MKKLILFFLAVPLLVFSVVVFMAIFGLCPPIEAGPQPPWCTNPEFFERDFSREGLGGAFRVKTMEMLPYSQNPDSFYDPEKDGIDYFDEPVEVDDYSIKFGIALTDFFWPVCQDFSTCIDPRKKVEPSINRLDSMDTDFVVFTDYLSIDDEKNIFFSKFSLTQEEIDFKIDAAEEHGLDTMVLLNLFIDDSAARHMEMDDMDEDIRFGGSLHAQTVDGWDPDTENMNLLFDNWEETLIENLDRWEEADRIIVNPEDIHFHFLDHHELQNQRNRELINLARENYQGEVCVHFKELTFISDNPEIDYYEKADCVIIGGHLPYKYHGVENDVESFERFFSDYFNSDFFYQGLDVYQMISTMSYDDYIENQWFEVFDMENIGRDHEPDFRLQANAYEGMFRSLQREKPDIEGVFHYGYWWDDVNFERDDFDVALMNSIRNKDAEHVFYRWNQVIGR